MSGVSIGITILIVVLVPILFSSQLTRRSFQRHEPIQLPLELHVIRWMYPLVWMGGLVGGGICCMPLLFPNRSFLDFVFFGTVGGIGVLAGVMATIKLSNAYVRLTDETFSFRYGRKRQEIPLKDIKNVYTSLGNLILVTDEGNVVLPSFFKGAAELLSLLRRQCLQSQINSNSDRLEGDST